MLSSSLLLVVFAAAAGAWMPGQRHITAHSGDDLFTRSDSLESTGTGRRWLPSRVPIRGVNLGSMFIVEPWMASTEWSTVLNCGSTGSEFDCVKQLGQSTANANWANHWKSWITQSDIQTMASYR